ncbi:hypothetical protein ACF1BN_20280 [Streptomyces sp. NPDC014861]|uniref:hypothetical protein n=1 Tax=Streptomyces sp. NPDC014861 TaxID=3364923 RepID=UPI0036F602A1
MEPVTEHRRVSGPVVYGFLRLVRVSPARQVALHDALVEYCRRHEFALHGVFVERASGGHRAAAFTGLLDVLELPGAYGVVLPSRAHLGPKAVAVSRQERITASGARLLLVRGGCAPDSGRDALRPVHRARPHPAPDTDLRGRHA